jgi:hypothetical protein
MSNTRQSRLDAQDQYFLSNQLQSVDPTKYYHLVPGVVGRTIIPAIAGVSPNLPVHKWKMVKLKGSVKKGRGKSKNAPTVSAVRTEETQNIKTYEAAFDYTVDDVRAAREAGEDLPGDVQLAAVTSLEQNIDSCLATGDADSNITGLANNPNVAHTDAADKGGGVTSWLDPAADPDEILADIANAIEATQSALKQAKLPGQEQPMFDKFALYMPQRHVTRMTIKRLGSVNDVSLMKYIRDNLGDNIVAIKPWWRLDTADAANGNGPMAVLAPALPNGAMNPFVGGAVLPMDYEQLPEQYEGRNIVVPCASKCGGVAFRYTVAVRYLKKI